MYGDSLFYLNFTVKTQKCTNFIALKTITLYLSGMYRKIVRKNPEWPKMAVLNFSDNFSQKDWYRFGMAKNGCCKFFLTIFPKM